MQHYINRLKMTENEIKWQHPRVTINAFLSKSLFIFLPLDLILVFFFSLLDTIFGYFFTSLFHLCLTFLSFFVEPNSGFPMEFIHSRMFLSQQNLPHHHVFQCSSSSFHYTLGLRTMWAPSPWKGSSLFLPPVTAAVKHPSWLSWTQSGKTPV